MTRQRKMRGSPVAQHEEEIRRNLRSWESKPVLRDLYLCFHRLIARRLSSLPAAKVVELGSGIGNIRDAIPECIRTDLFPNPWIDRVENAYSLSFPRESLSDLILFDVFHHLRYPGTALEEFHRVLMPKGRVVIFDPCTSALGLLVFGWFHHEPLGLRDEIEWLAPPQWSPEDIDYYAAQANASRIFVKGEFKERMTGFRLVRVRRLSAISYVAAGGYSKPQLFPDAALPVMRFLDRVCDTLPALFATRVLVVLEKTDSGEDF